MNPKGVVMGLELEIRLRLLKPIPDINCEVTYSIARNGIKLYNVCIGGGKYVVWDSIFEDPDYSKKIESLEKKLYDIVVSEAALVDGISKIGDHRLRHIAERQFFGYGILEPFFMDSHIMNVHVHAHKPIQVIHRVAGRLNTNLVLDSEEVKELAMRLATSAGKVLSEATPLTSFIEPRYEARVTIVYQSDITMRKGMAIDIRKSPENPWTILKLISLGSLSIEEAAFLWLMVKYKVPIVIVGEMLTGKTTLATALLALIPPGSRVLTIEDAPEIRIPTPYWIRTTIRDFGEYKITVFDLLKTGVRLSVDYIIVGEIRGEEAREWAQSILLGHGAITTFHAESPESALVRLLSPPISVDPQVVKLLNVFVKTNAIEREPGKTVFRHEVYANEEGRVVPVFVYDAQSDRIVLGREINHPIEDLKFVNRITMAHRVTKEALVKEYEIMRDILAEVYASSVKQDPTLERPTYTELAEILYSKLRERLAGLRATWPT